MFYRDENGRLHCSECCIACDRDKKTCEAYKERGRKVRRDIYKAKRERDKKCVD